MRLERTLNLAAAKPLWNEFAAARGGAITVDASEVELLGGLCLQVILAAAADWKREAKQFDIIAPSPAFLEALRLMGAEEHLPISRERAQ